MYSYNCWRLFDAGGGFRMRHKHGVFFLFSLEHDGGFDFQPSVYLQRECLGGNGLNTQKENNSFRCDNTSD